MNTNISKNSAVFLVIVLVAGTISTMIPTTFAQSYEDSYGKDKKASNLNKQNVNCNNIIINGVDSAGQGSGGDMINAMTNDGDDGTGQWIENGNDKKDSNAINENIVNFCKNKHNKIVVVAEQEPEEPQTPEEPTAILLVTKQLTCEDEIEDDCEDLRTLINENSFLLQVEGNNPDPSSPFPGSVTGTDVTLGPGNYVVSEIFTDAFVEALNTFRANHPGVGSIVIEISFTGDCNRVGPLMGATGTITAGESQICNALNKFIIVQGIP